MVLTIQIFVEPVAPNGQGFTTEIYRNLHGRESDMYGRAYSCGRPGYSTETCYERLVADGAI